MAVLTTSAKTSPFPYAAAAAATFTNKADLVFEDEAVPTILDLDGMKVEGDEAIVLAIAKAGGLSDDSDKSQQFFILANALGKTTVVPEIIASLDSLDDHLAYRTFLVGNDITAADFLVWGAIKGSIKIVGLLKNNKHQHLSRWFSHFESLESTQAAIAALAEAKANKARGNKTAASFALGLAGAKEGEVITRFPPEPSGYLHIGHTKAALLNQYFAKMYKGKLIIRFDDTNPTKERSEFEETILEDLALLDIQGDKVTHTSDYFDYLYDLAVKLIESSKAYADDTEQQQMRAERMDGIASKRRDASVEENLKWFAEMKAGSEEGLRWCIRAKMSVDNPNKALRDPVIYRCNVLPHHRTGDKWKIYPTYDFACPIVDSLEGVTHALRTNEYRDRNPQYQWMIEALNIRPVQIWDFSRLNFIYTLLSKRKLHWFVEKGLVKGWDDPRFPTVRGIRRRGMTVEALRQFMLAQGPSQAIVSLEWDSIWSLNKKIIDPVAPRFWAINKKAKVPVAIKGGPASVETKTLPRHKKNAEVGEKKTAYSSSILVEQDDALSFEDNEEITLMDWGNAFVRSKTTDANGVVTSIEMELHLDGDFRKTKKKVTWLAQPAEHKLVDTVLLDYDYIITKKKLEEDDKVEDFVTPVTEFREEAYTDANVIELKQGDIIQFERKGYYVFDGIVDGVREFIRIPDGRAAGLASKAVTEPNKGKYDQAASATAQPALTAATAEYPTTMYEVTPVYGDSTAIPPTETSMYKVKNVYDV